MSKGSALTQVGIGKETTAGTPVTPTMMLPVTNISVSENRGRLVDESFRGRMSAQAYAVQEGPSSVEISLEGYVIPTGAFGLLLLGVFGTDTPSGAGPYLHTYSVAPSTYALTSFTVVRNTGISGSNTDQFNFCRMNELTLNWSTEEYWTYSATLIGRRSAARVAAPSLTEPTDVRLRGVDTSVTIGGSATTHVESASVTWTRNATPLHTAGSNFDVPFGPLDGTFSINTIFDAVTDYDRVLNASESTVVILADNVSQSRSLSLTMTAPSWDSTDLTPGGISDIWRVGFEGRQKYSATDAGICQCVLENSTASY